LIRTKNQDSRTKIQEPRAKIQEPRAKNQEPRDKNQETRDKRQEPRFYTNQQITNSNWIQKEIMFICMIKLTFNRYAF